MKVTVYTGKGGAGKTPISVNLALEHGWGIATNDTISVLSILEGLPEERVIEILPQEEFPKFPEAIDVVFDLGGAISTGSSPSILSAIKQSDCVLVPIENNVQSIAGGIVTLNEIQNYNDRIVVVATKLKRTRHEPKAVPTQKTKAFIRIRDGLSSAGLGKFPILPLRFSEGFETIFNEGVSIEEMVRGGGLRAYSYRDLKKELSAINKFIFDSES